MLLIAITSIASSAAYAIGACPPLGQATSCSILVQIEPSGRLSFRFDPSVKTFDGSLVGARIVGVENRSGSTVFGISLSGSRIFVDSGRGAFGGKYPGPGTAFTIQDSDSGTVDFVDGLEDRGFIYFSISNVLPTSRPPEVALSNTITLDPGHGFSCAAIKQDVGAVGLTDFPATQPPAGKLREDTLTVAIARALEKRLTADSFIVTMTKSDEQKCPSFRERGEIANNAKSNIFLSIHINAGSRLPFGLFSGVSALYNPERSSARKLAELLTPPLSQNLGMSDRGAVARDGLAVLKPTVTRMAAVLAEMGRLSGEDEIILHNSGAPEKAASGAKSGINAFLGQ